jgi:glycosyltransferase involved in cell wall biosynthesis
MKWKKITDKIPFYLKWQAAKLGLKLAKGWNKTTGMREKYLTPAETKLKLNSKTRQNLQIIVFFDRLPMPDKDSAGVRMTALLEILSRLARVFYVPIYHTFENSAYEQMLEKMGVEVFSVFDFETCLKHEKIDLAILSYPFVADYMRPVIRRRFPAAKIVFDTVDVNFVRLGREFEITGDVEIRQEAERLKKVEIRAAKACDQVWCVTKNDKQFLQAEAPEAKIEVIPNIHQLFERGKPFAERRDLLFIGGFKHRPNTDAVFYFLDRIFPRILEKMPELRFHLVGSDAPPEILGLASENIVVHGFVPDVAPIFADCRVFVSPLRYGGGMKGKIGQALAFGLPVVTTSVGAEGMNLTDGREILIADEPLEFARQVLRVYDNQELWQSLSDNGYNFIAENLSPNAVEKKIKNALGQLAVGSGSRQ